MDKTIIHIGFPKSASSFLQEKVFPHLPVNYLYIYGPDKRILEMVESEREFDPEAIHSWITSELARKYPGGTNKTTVLSHEELSGHSHGYKTISASVTANNLKTLFPNAGILIIVRNQFDYMTTLYAWRISSKGYESRSWNRFISEEGAKGLFQHLEYDLLVEHYQQLFGDEHVAVIPMELLAQSPEEFFNRLFAFMKLSYQKIETERHVNANTNNVLILSFLRPLNLMFERLLSLLIFLFRRKDERTPFGKLRWKFYNSKNQISLRLDRVLPVQRKIDVTEYSQYPMLVERFGKSNARLERLIEYDLAALGYSVVRD